MDITIVIAQVLGIFFVVTGIAMVVNSNATAAAIEESTQHKGVMFTWGSIALLVGAVIIVLNNSWTSGLVLFITILGWLALAKGAFILLAPGAAISMYRKFGKGGMIVFCGVVVFAIGAYLLYR